MSFDANRCKEIGWEEVLWCLCSIQIDVMLVIMWFVTEDISSMVFNIIGETARAILGVTDSSLRMQWLRHMECHCKQIYQDDSSTNIDRGSNLTEDGHMECGASIMNGDSEAYGTVGSAPSTCKFDIYKIFVMFVK